MDAAAQVAALGARRFSLAFCAINSFLHLATQEEQLAALGAIFAIVLVAELAVTYVRKRII